MVPAEVVKATLWICFKGRAIGSAYLLSFVPRNIASDLLYTKYVSSLPTSRDKFALKYPLSGCELKNIVSDLGSKVRLWQGWPTGTPKAVRIPSSWKHESSKTS